MVTVNKVVEFILNSETVQAHVPAGMLALDYLRQHKILTGTKSGCKEGDCGACSVIIGELKKNSIEYRPMTSCLLPMGELHGRHLVTIEGLNMEHLSAVQNAMVDCGGTQCGYCTPGFVVCMTAGLMAPQVPLNEEGVLYAISGNLCRCTGYQSIKNAGIQAIQSLRDRLINKERIKALVEAKALPTYFLGIAERLKAIEPNEILQMGLQQRGCTIVAGGTDLYVQRGEQLAESSITLLNNGSEIPSATACEGRVIIDARMTFEAFATDPVIKTHVQEIYDYNLLMASWPIRTRSTIGGNLCNASPIADMTCLLLALECSLILTSPDGHRRELPLNEFYLGYKQLNKKSDEVVTEISFPVFSENTYFNWEKVSKRAWLDIATVNASCKFEVKENHFTHSSMALGGVSATPLHLKEASAFLDGKPVSMDTFLDCLAVALSEFEPIGDVRGSAHYKRLLARQLLLANFVKLFPETINQEALYAAL